ncbi:type III-A CRISPR-associated protein Csm2 [Chlorobaculum sp. 24CR]|uniref:type III-A CRISPR-associated protein Csm2 n=1 Tax=Chlorobaculum sp. 24CR TaxID=2508878 RepID=UPI00100A5B91|nr:type III-A CRISPR-associated protein Csm2 [Chlorobaculum sp. 24CR]RXK84874.1 type III-A CRISPR-associated protein Csm2 [Chlorobaculum sp. 24CR]
MALYNNIEELLDGSGEAWVNAVNEMKNQSSKKLVANIIEPRLVSLPADKIVQYGLVIGYKCKESKLKYSQLRRYVDEIKTIEQSLDKINKIKFFRIPLLHGYSRQKEQLEPFYQFVDGIIKSNKIQEENDFKAFVNLIDSITAHFEAFREDNND